MIETTHTQTQEPAVSTVPFISKFQPTAQLNIALRLASSNI